MDMTSQELWSAAGQVAIVIAVSFVVLCVITSLVRFQLMAEKAADAAELGDGEDRNFRMQVVNAIALARKQREPVSVVLLRIPDESGLGPAEARLRAALRAGDAIMPCGGSVLGAVLACGSERVGSVVARILGDATGPALPGMDQWRFGVAGYPEHGLKASVLYPRALAMIEEATTQGIPVAGMALPEEVGEDAPQPPGTVDELTGLIREEKMVDVLRRYIARERKAERAVSLIYFEIDQFDRLKAQLGDQASAALIKEVAGAINKGLRERDILARFGDAGFVAALPVRPEVAMIAAQRVAGLVRKRAFKAGGDGTKVTLSAGLAGYPEVQGTAVHYFVAAEQALNQARQRGRNQLVRFDPTMVAPGGENEAVDRL